GAEAMEGRRSRSATLSRLCQRSAFPAPTVRLGPHVLGRSQLPWRGIAPAESKRPRSRTFAPQMREALQGLFGGWNVARWNPPQHLMSFCRFLEPFATPLHHRRVRRAIDECEE